MPKEIKIRAVLSKDVVLTEKQRSLLAKALQLAGETMIYTVSTRGDEEITVTANDEQ